MRSSRRSSSCADTAVPARLKSSNGRAPPERRRFITSTTISCRCPEKSVRRRRDHTTSRGACERSATCSIMRRLLIAPMKDCAANSSATFRVTGSCRPMLIAPSTFSRRRRPTGRRLSATWDSAVMTSILHLRCPASSEFWTLGPTSASRSSDRSRCHKRSSDSPTA